MLKVYIYSGGLASQSPSKQLAVLDIAYAKKSYLSDYTVALSLRGVGEVQPDTVEQYPRWSASLWDLVARALTRILYRSDQAPAQSKPDKRCAYATKICARIERSSLDERGVELGTVEIAQDPKRRGAYEAVFWEEPNTTRRVTFCYGLKSLSVTDLLLRAICWDLFDQDTLGERPGLILPATLTIEGKEQFHVPTLKEPAKTGFMRYLQDRHTSVQKMAQMALVEDYVKFLMEG